MEKLNQYMIGLDIKSNKIIKFKKNDNMKNQITKMLGIDEQDLIEVYADKIHLEIVFENKKTNDYVYVTVQNDINYSIIDQVRLRMNFDVLLAKLVKKGIVFLKEKNEEIDEGMILLNDFLDDVCPDENLDDKQKEILVKTIKQVLNNVNVIDKQGKKVLVEEEQIEKMLFKNYEKDTKQIIEDLKNMQFFKDISKNIYRYRIFSFSESSFDDFFIG